MHIFCTFTGPFMGVVHLSLGSNHHLTGCASRPWRPRANLPHPPHRPLDIGSDQFHAVLRVHMTFSLITITTAINVRHRLPVSTSDRDLTPLFVQHPPSLLLYDQAAQQILAFLVSSLRLLVPPFLPPPNQVYRTWNQNLVLLHIPCL